MSPGDIGVILGAIAAVGALLVSYLAYRQSTVKDKQQVDADSIKTAITIALTPVQESLARVDTRSAVLETKVDMLWANLQKDMARILHSPDPRRRHVDFLMDKLINDVPLSSDEENELREILDKIKHYEPDHPSGLDFPVRDGEQVVAAFLLRSLDYVPTKRSK